MSVDWLISKQQIAKSLIKSETLGGGWLYLTDESISSFNIKQLAY